MATGGVKFKQERLGLRVKEVVGENIDSGREGKWWVSDIAHVGRGRKLRQLEKQCFLRAVGYSCMKNFRGDIHMLGGEWGVR